MNFFQDKVVEHFVEMSEVYANRRGMVHEEDPEILDIISNSGIARGRILEIGGGSGYLLDLLDERSNAFRLYNCELTWQAYRRQANPVINLVGGNVLSLPFDECEFDFVIAKNLLHHLVSKTRGASKKLAQLATMELIRVSKRGGHVILLEQYHQHKIFSSAIFYTTLILSILGIRVEALGIGRKVVVSFLTPTELRALFDHQNLRRGKVVVDRAVDLPVPPAFRLFPFLNRLGRLLYIKAME